MNFSVAMFYENYLTSDFHTNTVLPTRQNGVEHRDNAYYVTVKWLRLAPKSISSMLNWSI